jgi:pimeloyl-ACP methyl ester carboxylesterase
LAEDFGLPLIEAARRSGVTVARNEAFEDMHVTLNGLRFHYLDWGGAEKPGMLCLHGRAQNAHMWDFTALAFGVRYRILAVDQRGHGDSQWARDGDYGEEAHQRDLSAYVDALGVEALILVGLSMGGRNAMTYAAQNPRKVRALVVVDIGPETRRQGVERIRRFVAGADVEDSFEAFVQRAQRYNPRRAAWQIRGSLRHNLRQLPDGRWTWKYDPVLRAPGSLASASQDQDPAHRWALWDRIQCPVLIVRGSQSDVLAPEVALRMHQRLPQSRLVEVPGAGHLVPGDNPTGFEQALGAFLAEVENPGAGFIHRAR